MPVDPWMIDASGGAPAYTAQEARLLLVTPFMAGAGASLGVRSGVRPSGSGTDFLVQAQGSPNMSVFVNTGTVIVQGAISVTQGAYTWALDTTTTLTIAAAHATLARTDLVVVRIRDANVDTSGQRDGAVTVITGTAGAGVPSLPTDATYITIAQITVRSVSAGGGTIVSGDINTIRPFTAALGGTIPCLSTARPTGVAESTRIWETDAKLSRIWDGTRWRLDGDYRDSITVSSPTSLVTISNIPRTLRRIIVTWTARNDTDSRMFMRVNGDPNGGGRYMTQFWNAFTAGTGNGTDTTTAAVLLGATLVGALPGPWGGGVVHINGWDAPHADFLTGTAHSGYIINSTGSSHDSVSTWNYSGSSANGYTSLNFLPGGGNFQPGTQFVLTGSE